MGKSGRKGNGEGSVYQRASDGRWCAAYQDATRKRHVLYCPRTRNSALEARRLLRRAIADLESGVDTVGASQTLERFLRHWLEMVKRERANATYRNYRTMCEHHILPLLGRRRIGQVMPQDIDRLLRRMAEQGAADTSIRLCKATLSAALSQAVRWSLVPYNAASRTGTPRGVVYEHRPLTREQAMAFLEACESDPYGLPLTLALMLGLRIGELLGLKWAHLDLETGDLQVPGTKSESSKRALQVPRSLLPRLREHRAQQLQCRFDPAWKDGDYLFSLGGGKPIGDMTLQRHFKACLRQAGCPERTRIHDLRKTFGTLQLDAGQSLIMVSRLLGHSNTQVTERVYVEVLKDRQAQALEDLSEYLGLVVEKGL